MLFFKRSQRHSVFQICQILGIIHLHQKRKIRFGYRPLAQKKKKKYDFL